MTSANPHGEPLIIDNAEAALRLAGLADALLLHDRDILIRCDDSVVRPAPAGPAFVRRARGYVPVPIPLAKGGPTVLLHHLCHKEIHARFSETELARRFPTIEAIRADGRMTPFLTWIAKRPPEFLSRTRR